MRHACVALAALLALAGCGDGTGDNELSGSSVKSYNLAFDSVVVQKQTAGGVFKAMVVRYIKQRKGANPSNPVVVVANAPVKEGEKKDITGNNGSIYRVMDDGSVFPDVKTGHITFSSLGEVGEKGAGEFYVTFNDSLKTTLNGTFSATVTAIGD